MPVKEMLSRLVHMHGDLYTCMYNYALFLPSVIVHMENNPGEDDPSGDVTSNAIENGMCLYKYCMCIIHTHDRNLANQMNVILYSWLW